MKKIFAVARWEYVEKIRTKAFLISVIITPIIIILYSIVPALFAEEHTDETKLIGILNNSDISFSELDNELSVYKLKNNQPAYLLINLNESGKSFDENKLDADEKTKSGRIYGYLFVDGTSSDKLNLEFRTSIISDPQDMERFGIAFNNIRLKRQLLLLNINPESIGFVTNNIQIKQTQINEKVKSNKDFVSVFYRSIIFIILLTLMIIYSGQMLVRSLLEEKSNRLIEILVSSCKPEELLAGKIIGLSALGLTQMVLWFLIASILMGTEIISITSFHNIPEIIIYFILGFIFYSSLLVGIGSIVSTEQEAQQITSYLTMVLIIPIIIILPAIQNPDSIFMKVLTYFPLTLPSVMILKLNIIDISFLELLITILIMLLSIILMINISSKIFKVGILYYDRMPTFREIKIWIFRK
ncbi:MAG TPA: ABC transporter permease [Ignavibacteriaceae bacterium]|nr:ABC transporter permease [Ignavibacteriaceae bacterium]